MAGLQNARMDSEAALAAKPEPNQVPTDPGGPVHRKNRSWPPAPPTWRDTIFSVHAPASLRVVRAPP